MELPHAPLDHYYGAEANRQAWVREIFDRSAVDYERVHSAMALGTGAWYRRRALIGSGLRPGLREGMRVVDVGVGTGLVAREAAAIVGDPRLVTGVDPSQGMLEHARVPAGVRLLLGTAEKIPVADESADFLSLGYALRHLADLEAAFNEFFRVLRPGGVLCVLEFALPKRRVARALWSGYLRHVVPWLATRLAPDHHMPELMRYTWETIETCVPPEVVMHHIESAGFEDVSREVELGIFSAYRASKPNPRSYCLRNGPL
jgi:demethylmenaquinone methyltransferase/2-methoxy-6-polyprenyl-1,4-benzoquinol methylase